MPPPSPQDRHEGHPDRRPEPSADRPGRARAAPAYGPDPGPGPSGEAEAGPSADAEAGADAEVEVEALIRQTRRLRARVAELRRAVAGAVPAEGPVSGKSDGEAARALRTAQDTGAGDTGAEIGDSGDAAQLANAESARTAEDAGDTGHEGDAVRAADTASATAPLAGPRPPARHWQHAVCDLAVHQLDAVAAQLALLREDARPAAAPPAVPVPRGAGDGGVYRPPGPGLAGSAEWDLLTDRAHWSEELHRLFGRPSSAGPLTLDELPSHVLPADQPALTALITACLVDGRPLDGEFRVLRPDGGVRTVRMTGEPVLDSTGCAASLWAVFREVGEVRRDGTGGTGVAEGPRAGGERRLTVGMQEAVLPSWRDALRFPVDGGRGAVDAAARYLPAPTGAPVGGDWYDAVQLPDGRTLLTVGDLTGHGVTAALGVATLLGALRGLALAGLDPAALLGHLDTLLDGATQPTLASALCCRYDPATRQLEWAQAGHPAPLLFRAGAEAGAVLPAPEGVLLGAAPGAAYGSRTERIAAGDVLVLHTDGLLPRRLPDADPEAPARRLLALGPRFGAARTARDCVRAVVEEVGAAAREDDACLLVARFP
jgi:PAS domain-containing protein